MKNTSDILDDLSHQLNSPLASAKSYIYLSKRRLEKKEIEKASGYIDMLEAKIDTLAGRIDLLLTLLRLENGSATFTYSLFPVSKITEDPRHTTELLADQELIMKVFSYAKALTRAHTIAHSSLTMSVEFTLQYEHWTTSDNKDTRTELIEKELIMNRLVTAHGGTINDTGKTLKITLPLKAKYKQQ